MGSRRCLIICGSIGDKECTGTLCLLRSRHLFIPLRIWSVLGHAAIEVFRAVRPPWGSPLAECNLCDIDCGARVCKFSRFPVFKRGLHITAGGRQFIHERSSHRLWNIWIARAPKASANNNVSPVWRHQGLVHPKASAYPCRDSLILRWRLADKVIVIMRARLSSPVISYGAAL